MRDALLWDLRIEVVAGVLEQESKIQTRGVSISSGNNLLVISIFGYTTTIVVYDGLMHVTDGNKVQMNFRFETRLCVSHIFDALVGTTMGDIGIWKVASWEKLVLKNSKAGYLSAVSISQQDVPRMYKNLWQFPVFTYTVELAGCTLTRKQPRIRSKLKKMHPCQLGDTCDYE
ncbi:hypothetical protein Tco_1018505 [Tanacetum coccineum]|uniref:Uncharacterized protein n=1 Tax=Tanacetum coccineum TaxID=301880 RepID=A0ABQ5FUJ8_9ASTR